MNRQIARNAKATAIAFTLLMLVPSLALAEHTVDRVPDIPVLGQAKPSDECIGTGIPVEVAAAYAAVTQGQPGPYLAEDKGVPALCGPGSNEYRQVIAQADAILENYRNATREIQRQADARVEALMPESASPVRPRVTILDDRFDGRAVGGIGDWQVVTQSGDEPEFERVTRADFNGTVTEYRFGSDEGYERGVHEFLVSPELDLRTIRGDPDQVRNLQFARSLARAQLAEMCTPAPGQSPGFNPRTSGITDADRGALSFFCGPNQGAVSMNGNALVRPYSLVVAYQAAFDQIMNNVPLGQPIVTLDLTYRMNFPIGYDGFRIWAYVGDQAPDRVTLFDSRFGSEGFASACRGTDNGRDGLNTAAGYTTAVDVRQQYNSVAMTNGTDTTCTMRPRGGTLIPLDGNVSTTAFTRFVSPSTNASSGYMAQPETVRIDLSPFVTNRVWLVVEVATTPDSNRGEDYFSKSYFPEEQKAYGLSISHVKVEGDAWPRNVRLHEFIAPRFQTYRDEDGTLVTARTAVPPGNEPLLLPVHNAGVYTENATITVTFASSTVTGGEPISLNKDVTLDVRNLRPSETRIYSVPWPVAIADGTEYTVRASMVVEEFDAGDVTSANQANQTLEPSRTNARIPNYASRPDAAALSTTAIVQSFIKHELTPTPVLGTGIPIMVCADAPRDDGTCSALFAGKKGQPRVLQTGVRNDGNTAVNAVATLHLTLDGVEKSDAILDGARRDLTNLLPQELRTLTWSLALNEPGVYEATVSYEIPKTKFVPVTTSRYVFTQQTTGTICFDNMDDARECGAMFAATLPKHLEGQNVTAATFLPDGRLLATTAIGPRNHNITIRDEAGAWTTIRGFAPATLDAEFGSSKPALGWGVIRTATASPTGVAYLGGTNGTLLQLTPTGQLTPLGWANKTAHGNFTVGSLAWWNGTLWAVANGTFFWLNGTSLEAAEMREEPSHMGKFRAVATNGTMAFAVGDNGTLYVDFGHGWNLTSSHPSTLPDAFMPNGTEFDGTPRHRPCGEFEIAKVCRQNLTHVAFLDDLVYVFGDNGLLYSTTDGRAFAERQAPTNGRLSTVLATHLQTIYVIDATGRAYTCTDCTDPERIQWMQPELSIPYTKGDGDMPVKSRLRAAAASPTLSALLGDGGTVLLYEDTGFYANHGDWSTEPTLVPTHGGALQTDVVSFAQAQSSNSQWTGATWRLTPESADFANTGKMLRVTITHNISRMSTNTLAEIRLIDRDYQTGQPHSASGGLNTCPGARPTGVSAPRSCDNFVAASYTFSRVTYGYGWNTTSFDVTLSERFPAGRLALELVAVPGTTWTVDDVRVEVLDRGTPYPILAYYGPGAARCVDADSPLPCNRGFGGNANISGITLPGSSTPLTCGTPGICTVWSEVSQRGELLDIDRVSPWHLSRTLSDRPVWVFNDAVWANASGGSAPRLRDNHNSRLISPVLDLTNAYDPVISFRHTYAFRTQSSGQTATIGDVGLIEVQYLRKGAECVGTTDPEATCWSPFFVVEPEGGYPTNTTYRLTSASWGDSSNPPLLSPTAMKYFWGVLAQPDEQGIISDPRSTSNYREVRVRLADADIRSETGERVNLSGRELRVGFRAVTVHSADRVDYPAGFGSGFGAGTAWNHTHVNQAEAPRSFAGEGWYITDFKVLGASRLGVDLRAGNLTFPVGYDFTRVGVGPGQRVPVNFTVTNRGVFETLGYTAEVEVRRVVDAVLGRTELVATLALPQQPVLDAGRTVNHTVYWDVPAVENANYTLAVTVTPIGISEDEDVTDNVARLGTIAKPIPARTTPEFHVEFFVTPEQATSDITRYVPIFIVNTGNVPLSNIQVTRDITLLVGSSSRPSEPQRLWVTDQPVAAGTRAALASLDSEFDLINDLFWKAPERANYYFVVDARAPDVGLRSTVDTRVAAFATYLFDDVESGVTGEATSGSWTSETHWNITAPGFRSAESYTFGDLVTGRYASDSDRSMVSPVVDLANARSAQLAFYHRYNFEEGFDGGVVEASVDGGATWTPLTPLPDVLNGLHEGYANAYLSPSSTLHPTNDPTKPARAFTGDSSQLPGAVEGWILSQFDLTDFAAVTVPDVTYDTLALRDLRRESFGAYDVNGQRVYQDESWRVGPIEEYRYWEVQNLTQNRTRSIVGDDTFWWSGSPSYADDGVAPRNNTFLRIPVNLTAFQEGGSDVIEIEWWENAERVGARSLYLKPGLAWNSTDSLGTFTWMSGSVGQLWMLNISEPKIVERQGEWYRLVATLPDYFKGREFNVTWIYQPVQSPGTATREARFFDRHADDQGIAIDGFTVRAYALVNGQRTNQRILLDETSAWNTSRVEACLEIPPQTSTHVACHRNVDNRNLPGTGLRPLLAANGTALMSGDFWRRTTGTPALPQVWYPVYVNNEKNVGETDTKQRIQAFYTGDLLPNSESRLVTPAVDLSLVAGDNAALTFWHRYAFHQSIGMQDPVGSGGAVEIQRFDPLTGEWSDWEQIYPNATADRLNRSSLAPQPASAQTRYGYSSYSSNTTRDGSKIVMNSPPFENLWNETEQRAFQFYYSGSSSEVAGHQNNWLAERFDVSDYIGSTVRFGFHHYTSGIQRTTQSGVTIPVETGSRSGWWVRDVQLVGDVLAAQPLQVRLRAGSDGNVDAGFWQVDDIGLFGARYDRNVGVFVDNATGVYGGVQNSTTTIPVTIRNLGSTVRRGLGVEVLQIGSQSSRLTLSSDAPQNATTSNSYLLAGLNLAPGASTTVNLTVQAPREFTSPQDIRLLFVMREFNAEANEYARVTDNEVAGFLQTSLVFRLEPRGNLSIDQPATLPALGRVGEPVLYRVPVNNTGYTPLVVNSTCTAETIDSWPAKDHSRAEADVYTVKATAHCELVSGEASMVVPARSRAILEFEARPTVAGLLRFGLTGTYWDGFLERKFEATPVAAPVGVSPVAYSEPFIWQEAVPKNFSVVQPGTTPPRFSAEVGMTERGALHLGLPDTGQPQPQGGTGSVGFTYGATTPWVDLHNLTAGAYLSFWHLDRMTEGDGAHVRAQILMREALPNTTSSAQPSFRAGEPSPNPNILDCLLRPVGGYEGVVKSIAPVDGQTSPPPDQNPALNPAPPSGNVTPSGVNYFVARGGVMQDDWEFALFDLKSATCPVRVEGQVNSVQMSLIGHTVRFVFVYYAGPVVAESDIRRQPSYGFYVDDISVGPQRLSLRPDGQHARLLDNTTKQFNVIVRNDGATTDVVRVVYDAFNSSAPAGTVRGPAEDVTLQPGEERILPVYVTLPRDPSLLPTRYEVQLKAQSQLDRNAAGITRLTVDFAPREFAELAVSAQAPRSSVQDGTETFIPITVENNGLSMSVASTIRIVDRWMQNGVQRERVEELQLPSMSSFFLDADDASRILEYRWRPEAGSLGPHTLTFIVDPLVLGEEYTRDNNVVTITTTVTKLLIPDLSVAEDDALVLRNGVGAALTATIDAEVSRYEITAGDLVTFEVKVRNLGAGGVKNVDVRAFIGQLSLPPKTVPFIAPGGEAVLTFTWLSQRGEYPVEIVVRQVPPTDGATDPVELFTDNNRHPARGVAYLTVKDFEVSANATAPSGVVEPGTEIPVTFRLANSGNAGEELVLTAKLPAGWSVRFPRADLFLRSGETYEATATVSVPANAVAGEQFISILAVARENPMKVAASRTPVVVRAFYDGSVLPGIATVAPPEFVLEVPLANRGNSLEAWSVDLQLPQGWSTVEPLPAQVVVPARGEGALLVRVKLPAGTPPGLRDVGVSATMADGTTVNGTLKVDLLARRAASIVVLQDMPTQSRGAVTYPISVENVGNVRAPFQVVLTRVPEGLAVRVDPPTFDLAPGQKAQARLLVTPNSGATSGDYAVQTYAYFDGVNPDTSEGRANFADFGVSLARPDIELVRIEQTPRLDVKEGDRVVVRATVANRGASAVAALPVHLYVDDVYIAEATLPALAAGQTAEVVLNWTAVGGDHTITVVVDPYEDTVDVAREDNAASLEASVQGGAALGGVAAGRLDTPAPGLFGLLAALGVAMLAASGRVRRRQK